MRRLLIPNIGAEENRPQTRADRGLEDLALLWSLAFPLRGTVLLDRRAARDPQLEERRVRFVEQIGDTMRVSDDFLPLPQLSDWIGTIPWLSVSETSRAMGPRGVASAAPLPEIVRAVHDKAFALGVAGALEDHTADPRLDAGTRYMVAFEPEELRDTEAVRSRIEHHLRQWPDACGGGFVLKPRWGTSGRGRIHGERARPRALLSARSLDKLATRGGAVLEPWFDRICDYSTQLWVGPDGRVEILGTTRQRLSRHGVYTGNQGALSSDGQLVVDADDLPAGEEERLRQVAAHVGATAAQRGFFGPAGVDAFAYRWNGQLRMRRLVEFNARFTTGQIALALVRRAARSERVRPLGWLFSLTTPAAGWPPPSTGLRVLSLRPPGPPGPPGSPSASGEPGEAGGLAWSKARGLHMDPALVIGPPRALSAWLDTPLPAPSLNYS